MSNIGICQKNTLNIADLKQRVVNLTITDEYDYHNAYALLHALLEQCFQYRIQIEVLELNDQNADMDYFEMIATYDLLKSLTKIALKKIKSYQMNNTEEPVK